MSEVSGRTLRRIQELMANPPEALRIALDELDQVEDPGVLEKAAKKMSLALGLAVYEDRVPTMDAPPKERPHCREMEAASKAAPTPERSGSSEKAGKNRKRRSTKKPRQKRSKTPPPAPKAAGVSPPSGSSRRGATRSGAS